MMVDVSVFLTKQDPKPIDSIRRNVKSKSDQVQYGNRTFIVHWHSRSGYKIYIRTGSG